VRLSRGSHPFWTPGPSFRKPELGCGHRTPEGSPFRALASAARLSPGQSRVPQLQGWVIQSASLKHQDLGLPHLTNVAFARLESNM
jgi:hypothetical protein